MTAEKVSDDSYSQHSISTPGIIISHMPGQSAVPEFVDSYNFALHDISWLLGSVAYRLYRESSSPSYGALSTSLVDVHLQTLV